MKIIIFCFTVLMLSLNNMLKLMKFITFLIFPGAVFMSFQKRFKNHFLKQFLVCNQTLRYPETG